MVHFFYVANWASRLWNSTLCRREKCLWSTSFRHSYFSRKHKSLESLPYLLPFWWPISNNIKCITEFLKMSVSVYVMFHLILYLMTFSCLLVHFESIKKKLLFYGRFFLIFAVIGFWDIGGSILFLFESLLFLLSLWYWKAKKKLLNIS